MGQNAGARTCAASAGGAELETFDARLPNLIVIGAMKCGTSALHGYLDAHPDIAMSSPKELNFFVGEADGAHPDGGGWHAGNWHRGIDWYRGRFPPGTPVRGEASPAYTSPSFPEAARRMAAVVPGARLVYLVRDPVERAVSQYLHHRREGTERRSLEAAVLDPRSQYLDRSRFFARLRPYLHHFPSDRILVVAQEDLRADPGSLVSALYRFAGVDASVALPERPAGTAPALRSIDGDLEGRLVTRLREDVAGLRAWLGRDLPGWRSY